MYMTHAYFSNIPCPQTLILSSSTSGISWTCWQKNNTPAGRPSPSFKPTKQPACYCPSANIHGPLHSPVGLFQNKESQKLVVRCYRSRRDRGGLTPLNVGPGCAASNLGLAPKTKQNGNKTVSPRVSSLGRVEESLHQLL